MAPTYCGIGGIARQLKEWPVGINGIVRQQKEVWAGVDGVSRKIFELQKDYNIWAYNSGGTLTIDGQSLNGSSILNKSQKVDCQAYVYNQYGSYHVRHNNVQKSQNYSFSVDANAFVFVQSALVSTIAIITSHGPCNVKIVINRHGAVYYDRAFVYAYDDTYQNLFLNTGMSDTIGPIGFSAGEKLKLVANDDYGSGNNIIKVNGETVATSQYTYTIEGDVTITCDQYSTYGTISVESA